MPIAYSQILNCQERILIQIFSAGAHLGLYKYVWGSFFSDKFQVPIFFAKVKIWSKRKGRKTKKQTSLILSSLTVFVIKV